MSKYDILKSHLVWAQQEFSDMRPHLVLANAGAEDEHWQIWNPSEESSFPVYVIDPETMRLYPHPDGTAAKNHAKGEW